MISRYWLKKIVSSYVVQGAHNGCTKYTVRCLGKLFYKTDVFSSREAAKLRREKFKYHCLTIYQMSLKRNVGIKIYGHSSENFVYIFPREEFRTVCEVMSVASQRLGLAIDSKIANIFQSEISGGGFLRKSHILS